MSSSSWRDSARVRWGGPGSTTAAVAWRVRPGDLSLFTRSAGPTNAPAVVEAARAETSVRLQARLAEAGGGAGLAWRERKPEWLRVKADLGEGYRAVRSTIRELSLATVCEEAGCPNIYECWADGTATFMINGDRCTRACGFCLVDTRKPAPPDVDEPGRVAEAVRRMGLKYAVITAVARDDLADGGAARVRRRVSAVCGP